MLIWRMVFDVRFAATSASTSAATTTTTIVTGRCVALSITAILANQPSNLVMSDRRKNFFRWLISVLFCCWNSSTASGSATTCIESSATSAGNNRRVIETIEMGPLSLREYVNTLEPYDPEKHGWRGEEPWGYRERIRRQYHHHHHYHQSVPIAAAAAESGELSESITSCCSFANAVRSVAGSSTFSSSAAVPITDDNDGGSTFKLHRLKTTTTTATTKPFRSAKDKNNNCPGNSAINNSAISNSAISNSAISSSMGSGSSVKDKNRWRNKKNRHQTSKSSLDDQSHLIYRPTVQLHQTISLLRYIVLKLIGVDVLFLKP